MISRPHCLLVLERSLNLLKIREIVFDPHCGLGVHSDEGLSILVGTHRGHMRIEIHGCTGLVAEAPASSGVNCDTL